VSSGDDEEHGVQIGPVMIYTARQKAVAKFYDELIGLSGDLDDPSIWLKGSNGDVVVHGQGERQMPQEIRGQLGFVVWFGVADVNAAHERAKRDGSLVGDFYGDYFFARDPDGRFLGIYATEDHHHDHEH
jgi:predicted enzyme related to lactoylglutathione lyase